MAAVAQNGYALEYASEELKNDEEIMMVAVTSHAHDQSIEMIDTVNNEISLLGKENIKKKEKRRWRRKRIPNRASGGVQIAKRKKTETRKQRTQWNKNSVT